MGLDTYYADQEKAKQQQHFDSMYANKCGDALQSGIQGSMTNSAYIQPSMQEQMKKQSQEHYALGDRLRRGSEFMAAHPEFEEFIKLIREGAIQI